MNQSRKRNSFVLQYFYINPYLKNKILVQHITTLLTPYKNCFCTAITQLPTTVCPFKIVVRQSPIFTCTETCRLAQPGLNCNSVQGLGLLLCSHRGKRTEFLALWCLVNAGHVTMLALWLRKIRLRERFATLGFGDQHHTLQLVKTPAGNTFTFKQKILRMT